MKEKELTYDKYRFYKKHGLSDWALLREYGLTIGELKELKNRWKKIEWLKSSNNAF